MRIYNKIRGTMKEVPNTEVNKDTVYIRSNIKKVNEEEFKGWEYDEIQYNLKEYLENLSQAQDVQSMAILISSIMSEIDFLKQKNK